MSTTFHDNDQRRSFYVRHALELLWEAKARYGKHQYVRELESSVDTLFMKLAQMPMHSVITAWPILQITSQEPKEDAPQSDLSPATTAA